MSNGKKLSVNSRKSKVFAAGLAVLLSLLMLAGCSQMSGAEKKVSNELNALQASDSAGSEVMALRDSLSDEGRENFDGFLKKLRSFDYEITESREENNNDETCTVVTVRVKTFDFGREYLAAWTEYLKENGDSKPEDLSGFYEMLFSRLNSMSEKDSISYIDIVCIDPLDNGEWIASIKENEELQDALFGGMLSEMKALAAE